MKLRSVLLSCCIVVFFVQLATSQIPRTLSYQGVLADLSGSPKPDGIYNFTFRMYSVSSGGGSLWTEVQQLQVKKGLFSAVLGSVTPFPGFLDFRKQYWLGIQVANDGEMMPRVQLASVGSSFSAIQADVATTVPDSTLTQAKIASGQVVKSINNLHDRVTLQGANGAAVTTSGDTVTITASGGGGGGIGTIQNTDNTLAITNPAGPTTTVNLKSPLVIPGNLGIGGTPSWPFHLKMSESTGSGLQARVTNTSTTSNSFAAFSLESNNGAVVNQLAADGLGSGPLATPSGYLGTYTNHPLGLVTNNVERMHISSGGNVGIGTASPTLTLDIKTGTFGGGTRTFSDGAANFIVETIGGTNSWAKYYVKTASQQWSIGSSQNYNGNQLYFANENTGAIRMAIMPNGNVGINTTDPQAKLHAVSSSVAVKGESNIGVGVYASSSNGQAVFAEGNAGQSRDKGGFVKGMAYVNGDGALIRSYNGVNTSAIASSRGFFSEGSYYVDFPFQIDDRFVSVSVENNGWGIAVSYAFISATRLEVLVHATDQVGTLSDRPVMVIVY